MKPSNILLLIIVLLDFTFCHSSSQPNDITPTQFETPCSKIYVGTWESEKITKDDVEMKGENDKAYMKITKPDKNFRVFWKRGKDTEYIQVDHYFETFFDRCDMLLQSGKRVNYEAEIIHEENSEKVIFRITPYSMGYPEKGEMKVTYHRLK